MDATEIYFFLRTAHTIDFRQSACRSWHWTGIQYATGIGLWLANSPQAPFRHVAPFEKVRRAFSISDQSDVVETDVGAVAANPEIV
jgi:hypothetical protein